MAEVAASSSDYGTPFDRLTRLCCGLTLAFAIMRETYENEHVRLLSLYAVVLGPPLGRMSAIRKSDITPRKSPSV